MHLLTFALALTTAALPCSTPAHRAFDFWAGDWDGYDVGAEQVKAARVTVEIALDGCALYEVYEGTNGLVGRSLSAYDAGRGAWHQTWVTNRGQLLLVGGKVEGDSVVFEGTKTTDEELLVEDGALYPALRRMEKRGWLRSDWAISEKGRRARYYELSAAGKKALEKEGARWQRYVKAVAKLGEA